MLFTCEGGRDSGLCSFCFLGLTEGRGGKVITSRVDGLTLLWWGVWYSEKKWGWEAGSLSSCPGLSRGHWAVLGESLCECRPALRGMGDGFG